MLSQVRKLELDDIETKSRFWLPQSLIHLDMLPKTKYKIVWQIYLSLSSSFALQLLSSFLSFPCPHYLQNIRQVSVAFVKRFGFPGNEGSVHVACLLGWLWLGTQSLCNLCRNAFGPEPRAC